MTIELASLGTVSAALNESLGAVSAAVIFGGEYYDGKKNVFFNQLFALDPAAKVSLCLIIVAVLVSKNAASKIQQKYFKITVPNNSARGNLVHLREETGS